MITLSKMLCEHKLIKVEYAEKFILVTVRLFGEPAQTIEILKKQVFNSNFIMRPQIVYNEETFDLESFGFVQETETLVAGNVSKSTELATDKVDVVLKHWR